MALCHSLLLGVPTAPVCVDPERRRLFVADTPNNRIVVASLDSGEIQGVVRPPMQPFFPEVPALRPCCSLRLFPGCVRLLAACSPGLPVSAALAGFLLRGIQIGNGVPGVADGTWESAEFSEPGGLALDAEANALYVADGKARDGFLSSTQPPTDACLRLCAWAGPVTFSEEPHAVCEPQNARTVLVRDTGLAAPSSVRPALGPFALCLPGCTMGLPTCRAEWCAECHWLRGRTASRAALRL